MGQFTNTATNTYTSITTNMIQGYQNRVNAATAYTKFTDKKPTPVTYWNLNLDRTTIDSGTLQSYDQLNDEDPRRYNRILGFYLYGIDRISPSLSVGEFGLESSSIEGEALVLPNTIIPYENDYFAIDYLEGGDKLILFRVLAVNRDTLDNGNNFYKIHYQLDQTKKVVYEALLSQTVNTYKFIMSNVGTNLVCLLDEQTETSINALSNIVANLKQFYINLFYKTNVQTFVYPYDHGAALIYDPYLIEFLIRNNVFLSYDSNYLYISQATFKSQTFAIEYQRTLFRDIEERNPSLSLNTAWPIQICDPNSLLIDRMEEYLELSIQRQNYNFHDPINFLNMDLFDRIVNNKLYDEEDQSLPHYRNIIINYMNGEDVSSITSTQLQSIDNIEYARVKDLHYDIPLLVHALNTFITGIMTKNSADPLDNTSTTTLCPQITECAAINR